MRRVKALEGEIREDSRENRMQRSLQKKEVTMVDVYEEYSVLKVNGRETYIVDKDKYYYKKARSYSGIKVINMIVNSSCYD
jgi:hypothetical protein